MECVSVIDRTKFESKLLEKKKSDRKRCVWNKRELEEVQRILSNKNSIEKKNSATYHYLNTYELVTIGIESHVILKRINPSDDLIFIVAIEDYFPKLWEAHSATGHGGRDKMLYYVKKKWRIPRFACEIFLDCCETCNRRRPTIQQGVVRKPIVTKGFNSRAQVDLIDFQSTPDGEYSWLLNYQDHATKFLQLRPLKSKHAVNVAEELSKIFCTFGAPGKLQMDNGKEFDAEVVKQLVACWPDCEIIHGRPRHPQSQGSVERANGDVKTMLRAWMIDNKSTNWSHGCYNVQVCKLDCNQ